MISVAIVDDEESCRREIENCINRFMQEHNEQAKIMTYNDAIDLMTDYDFSYDIIFMDIDMKLSDGMKMSHKLREIDRKVCLIFETKLAKYAIEGYSVDALGYILKPVNYFNVALVLEKALDHITKNCSKINIVISERGKKVVCDSGDIIYIEVVGHALIFHTINGDYTDWGVLGDKEALLKQHYFIRVHRCYLVNLKYVSKVTENSVILKGGGTCILSRSKKKQLIQALSEYFNFHK